jgi:hypothetical protein
MENLNVSNTPSNVSISKNVMGSKPNPEASKFWSYAAILAAIGAFIYWIWTIFNTNKAEKEAAKAEKQRLLNATNSSDVVQNYVQDKLKGGDKE